MLKPTDKHESHPVIRWLMTEARKRTDPCEFLEAFAGELRAAGVDVSRVSTGVPILHPQIFSFSGLWQLQGHDRTFFPFDAAGFRHDVQQPDPDRL